MKKLKLSFSECEHNGDLDNYTADIIKCGGKIISEALDTDAEMGIVLAEVPETFFDAFNQTDAYDFVEFYSYL